MTNASPANASPLNRFAMFPTVNNLILNRERSSTGNLVRLSTRKKKTMRIPLNPMRTRFRTSVRLPIVRPSRSRVNKAEHQELLGSLGEAGEQRPYGEDGEAHVVQPDPAVQVRNSSNSYQKNSDHEPVDRDEPDTNNQVRVQSENYLWKAHNKNARVQRGHENADCSDGENDPLVLQGQTARLAGVSEPPPIEV